MNTMNFSDIYSQKNIHEFIKQCLSTTRQDIVNILGKEKFSFNDFLKLISPAAEKYLEDIAQAAHQLTAQRFGKIVQLYIPLYLSNVCTNICQYCGFRNDSREERYTLSIDEVIEEAKRIKEMGFNHLLLVSGTALKEVNMDYLQTVISLLKKEFASIVLEIYALEETDYHRLFQAGAEGVTVYQETYDQHLYDKYHLAGRKKDYIFRLNTPDRAGRAGLRRINLGSLLGLNDWRFEAVSLALHAEHILKYYWQSQLSLSFPRITNCPEDFQYTPVSDKELVQMIMAFRLLIPDLNLVISTRERPDFRMKLIPLGITQISAGSRTSPGGYADKRGSDAEQFAVEDKRDPRVVAEEIKSMGYEPVWKDWENVLA